MEQLLWCRVLFVCVLQNFLGHDCEFQLGGSCLLGAVVTKDKHRFWILKRLLAQIVAELILGSHAWRKRRSLSRASSLTGGSDRGGGAGAATPATVKDMLLGAEAASPAKSSTAPGTPATPATPAVTPKKVVNDKKRKRDDSSLESEESDSSSQ